MNAITQAQASQAGAAVSVRVPDERLDELARLAEKATPGPWVTSLFGVLRRDSRGTTFMDTADAAFIAAAGTDLAALVADLRAARADLDRARAREQELMVLLQQWLDLPLTVNGEAGLLRADNQRLRRLAENARNAGAAPEYDELAIRAALWILVDAVLEEA